MHPCPFDVQDAVGFRISGAPTHHTPHSPYAAPMDLLAAPPSAHHVQPHVDTVVTPCSLV
ncbi:hypothetical protein E2C01_094763 [Portunus trituberculatus]|uniref:Uncharacterized protein n=2 Tax=Portunus trituberculatus TaxID=210409 RepID=A0A5B7JXR9_PORTR|nr:hypothetical protein [Portunus trituberculatus]